MRLDTLRDRVYSGGIMPDLLRQLREEHRARERESEAELLHEHLLASGWSLAGAAATLGCGISSLQRALARHPDLERDRQQYGSGPGRPRKPAKS